MIRLSSWTALGAAAVIMGCAADDPLPPTEMRAQIQHHLGDLLDETNASIANSWGVLPQPDALALLERVVGVDTPVAQAVHQFGALIATRPAPLDVAAMIGYLDDRLFDEASYAGDGLYEVSPAIACAAADTGCADRFARLGLRLRTTASQPVAYGDAPLDSGITVAVQLGANHDEPLTVTLRSLDEAPDLTVTSVTAELDLDALQRALVTLTGVAGVPRTAMSGDLTVRLQGDPTGASLRVDIKRSIVIAVAGASGDLAGRDAFSLSSAMTKAFELLLVARGNALGTLELGVADTTFALPAVADGKRLGVHLAGLTANAALDRPPLELDVDHVSLGGRPATISLDGVTARTIDLNPNDGGALYLSIYPGERDPRTGLAFQTLHTTPRLDLRMTADHRVLGDAPRYDVSQIFLDGLVRATASPDRIELRNGTFRLDTTPAGHGFAATAGQCIRGVETTAPSAPPFVQWSVDACN